MNIKEYIESGILESYLLGELTPQERTQVEQLVAQHPELKEELAAIEVTMEQFAQAAAIKPSARVKESVMAKISSSGAKVVPLFNYWKYATAASIVFGLLASYLAFNYRQRWIETTLSLNTLIAQNQQVAQNYDVVNQKLKKIEDDFSVIENDAFKKVLMKGTQNDVSALASIYWNSNTEEVFLSIQKLKQISQESQFQLWAIVDGKPVDAGVFDTGFSGLLKMKNIKGATAFAVTIEPRGGKPSPTLETMQVMGAVAG